jgi:hypothetical protein
MPKDRMRSDPNMFPIRHRKYPLRSATAGLFGRDPPIAIDRTRRFAYDRGAGSVRRSGKIAPVPREGLKRERGEDVRHPMPRLSLQL